MQLTDTLHIRTTEDTGNLYHLVSRSHARGTNNLPVSSSMGIHPGELLALSSWARTTVLQGTEICISGLHETVLCRCRRLSTASKRTERHQSRVAKDADWLKTLQSFECSSPCI